MSGNKTNSSYAIDGRLADVIAAVTVLAAAKESEGSLKMWTYRLARPADSEVDACEKHWQAVFAQHQEFFLSYVWKGEAKIALRLRYANKTIDRDTGELHPELHKLTATERGELTSLPLDAAATGTLITTAVSLHQAALARRADARFFFQTFGPGLLAILGVIVGILLPVITKAVQPPQGPLKVSVDVLKLEGVKPPEQDEHDTPRPLDTKGGG